MEKIEVTDFIRWIIAKLEAGEEVKRFLSYPCY